MSREVLKQALEALENGKKVRAFGGCTKFQEPLEDAAITAIKESLAQPEQELVALEDTISNRRIISEDPGATISIMRGMQRTIDRLKAQPEQDAEAHLQAISDFGQEQEPVAVTGGGKTYQDLEFLPNAPQLENGTLLYASPPKREWVYMLGYKAGVKAALKEKNA